MSIRNSFIAISCRAPRRLSAFGLALVLTGCGGKDAPQASPGAAAATGNPLITMQPAAVRADPRAQIFLQKGCPQCHAIGKLGVVAQVQAGPDLSIAFEDVRSRFNVPLDSFLHNPTGTMQIVLSGQIQLSPAERDSIYRLLRDLYQNP